MTWEGTLKILDTQLGPDSCPALRKAYHYSQGQIWQLEQSLQKVTLALDPPETVGWTVWGSLGRLEALEASDIELVMLDSGEHEAGVLAELDRQTREAVREDLKVSVSEGKDFTSPTRPGAITAIGGSSDDVNSLTKRTLLMTESLPVLKPEVWRTVREDVFRAYLDSLKTKGKHMLALVNDTVRYYRQLCVDYKERVDDQNKPWAIRNMKLRHARKYWFFSTALGMVAVAIKFESEIQQAEEAARELLSQGPTQRLVGALSEAGLPSLVGVVTYYDRFLGRMAQAEVRDELKRLEHPNRYDSAVFRELKDNSDKLHRAMLEIVDSLPANWRRHLIGRFLL